MDFFERLARADAAVTRLYTRRKAWLWSIIALPGDGSDYKILSMPRFCTGHRPQT